MPSFLVQSPHVIYASSGLKTKQEKSFRTDFNPLWNAVINSFFHQKFRTTLMVTCEKSILIAVTLQFWNYGPHKSWEELLLSCLLKLREEEDNMMNTLPFKWLNISYYRPTKGLHAIDLFDFAYPVWKLHNPYCHKIHLCCVAGYTHSLHSKCDFFVFDVPIYILYYPHFLSSAKKYNIYIYIMYSVQKNIYFLREAHPLHLFNSWGH